MSRFSPSRRWAIALWTAAGVVWGTTLTTLVLDPARTGQSDEQSLSTSDLVSQASIPTPPDTGLVVIRLGGAPLTPSPEAASQESPPPAPETPQPTSSGS